MRRMVCCVALVVASVHGRAAAMIGDAKGWLSLDSAQVGNRLEYTASNTNRWAPIHAEVSFPMLDNLSPSVPMPFRVVLAPGETRRVFWLSQINPALGGGVRVQTRHGLGDPDVMPDPAATWLLPWRHGVRHQVVQGYFGGYTHQGEYALDFDLAEGEEICAAREGVVVEVKQDSDLGGESQGYADKANFVEIYHPDGVWTLYAHLQKNGARVAAGDRVEAGQVIGLAGHTGQARGPHLHYCLRRPTWEAEGSESMRHAFTLQGGLTVTAEEGAWLYAWHPGQPAFDEQKPDSRTLEALMGHRAAVPLNNKVEFRTETLMGRTWFYARNGRSRALAVKAGFRELQNYAATPVTPVTRVVPAGTEVFMLWIDQGKPEESRYQLEYGWRLPMEP